MKLANLVLQKSLSAGDDPFVLMPPVGFRSFLDAFPGNDINNLFFYFIRHKTLNEFEVGNGYLNVDGELVRVDIIQSSNNNLIVDFTAGYKEVTNDLPAEYQEQVLNQGSIVAVTDGVSDPYEINLAQSGVLFTNAGTLNKSYAVLPEPPDDRVVKFSFAIVNDDGFRVRAPSGVLIYLGTDTSSYVESTEPGSFIELVSVNDETYFATVVSGIWASE